ncbi:MAG: hypothetical protein KUG64_10530, partial [Cycloclasticus sp.]|nr:hypothetical protein [Cycloclasticus sp.]
MKPRQKNNITAVKQLCRNLQGVLCVLLFSCCVMPVLADAYEPGETAKKGRSVLSKPPALIVDPAKDLRTLDSTLSRKERSPEEIADVTIVQKLGVSLPMDLEFTDESGKIVKLGDYFNQGRPVVLNLGYYQCPMLCGLVLNATLDVAKKMDLKIGEDYDVITLSFNPSETSELAKLKKQTYLKQLGQEGAGKGWHFLVGQ